MSSTLAPRQPRPSSERIVETAEIEPASGASASAWEAGGSGLKPQALAWDDEHSYDARRARRSLSHGEGGVSEPSARAVETRPKHASRLGSTTCLLFANTR